MTLLLPAPARAQDITSNLVGHWKLDEATGTAITDSSGSGNNGTFSGATNVTPVQGQVGSAQRFDGSNDTITVADAASLDITGSFTISAWANFLTLSASTGHYIVEKAGGGSANYHFYYDSTALFCGSSAFNASYTWTPTLSTWYHLSCVFNDSADLIIFYVNGVEVRRVSTASTLTANNGSLLIGNSAIWPGEVPNGYLDDVRIYSRALSLADIGALNDRYEGKIRYNVNNRVPEYFNGTTWVGMGEAPYIPNAVEFDGADYLTRNSNLSGVGDSQRVMGSFWFKRFEGFGTRQFIFAINNTTTSSDANNRLRIELAADNTLTFGGRNSAGTAVLDVKSNTVFLDNRWHHVLFSFDLSNGANRYLYIDGVSDLAGTPTTHSGTFDFAVATNPRISVGARHGGTLPFDGYLAELWIDIENYQDISLAQNRLKFRDASGSPVNLGSTGATPFGTAPDVFLSGPTSTWETNDATGGGFTENGALGQSPTYPGGSVGHELYAISSLNHATNLQGVRASKLVGNYLYVCGNTTNRLTIVDVSNPAAPTITGTTTNAAINDCWGIDVAGNYAFVNGGASGNFSVFDVSNPAAPSYVTSLNHANFVGGGQIVVRGNYAYMAAYTSDAINIIDISTPTAPTLAGTVANSTTLNAAYPVLLDGNYLYSSGDISDRFMVVDISNPASPTVVSSTASAANYNLAELMTLHPDYPQYVYMTHSVAGGSGFVILDVTNKVSPTVVRVVSDSSIFSNPRDIHIVDDRLYIADDSYDTITVYDVSNPTNPVFLNYYFQAAMLDGPHEFEVANSKIYTTGLSGNEIAILGFAGCANPSRDEGSILYNSTSNVMQYCDSVNWRAMGIVPGTGGGGCTTPTRATGSMIYNYDQKVMQYCDGATWRMIGRKVVAPTSGLVAHWPMDQSSGTTVTDVIGGNNNGTMSNGPVWSTGRFGTGSLYFDDTNDTVSTANESTFDFNRTDPFTISAWSYRMGTTSGEDDVVEKYTSSGGSPLGYWLYFGGSVQNLFFGMQNGPASGRLEVHTPNISLNAWHHLVATYDGTSSPNGMKIYVDGVPVTLTTDYNTLSSGSILHNSPITIGDDGGAGSAVFNGYLDDVRIYNRALSAQEANDLYLSTGGQ